MYPAVVSSGDDQLVHPHQPRCAGKVALHARTALRLSSQSDDVRETLGETRTATTSVGAPLAVPADSAIDAAVSYA